MDLDPLTAAITALSEHDETCPRCAETLPDFECEARIRLKAAKRLTWRQSVRDDALRLAADAAQRGAATGSAPAATVE